MAIRTLFTELFQVAHPLVLAPMGGVSGGALAAAVSEAGGLGAVGGGYESDRVAAEKVLALVPGLRRSALENRRFLRRVVRFLAAEAGVSQFLDIGVGLPTQGAVLTTS